MNELIDKIVNLMLMPFTWDSILVYFPFGVLVITFSFGLVRRLMGRW